jgi:pimeloyl-ACP methyl ester carboxylesterase
MMCDERLFEPKISGFSSTRQVTVMPLRGRASITELAQDILEEAPKTFALLGLSMGGIVAMEIIRQAPERVTRLALFDTNPMADAPERKLIRDQQIQRVEQGELRAIMRDEMKPNYLADGENKTAILELCMELAEGLGPQPFIDQSNALRSRDDQSQTLTSISSKSGYGEGGFGNTCILSKLNNFSE